MSKKKNKIENPLKGIPIKSLIFTLVMILLFIACGFGLGYGVRGCVDQRENQALTAYAEASSYSDNDYTVVTFSTLGLRDSDVFAFMPKIIFLNHSLDVYPNGRLEPVVFSTMTPVIDLSTETLSWVDNNRLGVSLPYSLLIEPGEGLSYAEISSVFEAVSSSFSVVPLTYRAFALLSGNLTGDWELLRVEGFYYFLNTSTFLQYMGLRAIYSNGAIVYIGITWTQYRFTVDSPLNYSVQPSFVFYNTSETGLTAEAYERGKLAGMADLEDRVREANQNGYNRGKAEGEQLGYQRGLDTALDDISPFNVIVSGVNSFLRTEILPGVQLTIILSVGFGLLLLGFSIKIFLGG